jgi:hypothetical protein
MERIVNDSRWINFKNKSDWDNIRIFFKGQEMYLNPYPIKYRGTKKGKTRHKN